MDMDPGSTSLIPRYLALIIVLLIGGGYFAAAETAFASVNPIRMIAAADNGSRRARKALEVLDNFDEALTAILIGNNIMHIGCSSAATLLASKLWGNASVTLVTFITAFTVFIFAEMIPKSYAKECNETLAPRLAPSLIFFIKMLTPLVFIFSGISSLLSRLAGADAEEDVTLSEEEVFDIIENIDDGDEIEADTTELVQSALEFTETTAADILTPWEKVLTIPDDIDNDALMQFLLETHYSRFPVVDADGGIVGILLARRFLRAKLQGRKILRSKASLDEPHYVDASMQIDELLEDMSTSRTHMAVVRGADGTVTGIVTIEDILEELVGEIYDEEETEDESK